MKKYLLITLFSVLLVFHSNQTSKAQSFELIGGNILNGALTGSILGTATMGLQNSSNFTPLRIGLGSGILAGSGIAIYDVATLPQGHEFFISGTLNDGNNSSIIILLDTVYGATVGAAIGSAVVLIGNKSFVKGIQYGTSAGAWAGFGFGLVDSFMLAERNRDFISDLLMNRHSLAEFQLFDTDIQLVQPDIFSYLDFSGQGLSHRFEPSLKVVSFSKSF